MMYQITYLLTLEERAPRSKRSLKKMHTSAKSVLLAKSIEMMRFRRASLYTCRRIDNSG